MSVKDEWAQLVSTTDIQADPQIITNKKYFIGRSSGANLCLHNNKLVSGTHCFIEKDELGQVWLQDCSTNGTLLNLTEKVVGKRVPLKHGDEISLVYKKNNPAHNVAYVFQDLARLAEEEADETVIESSELDTSATAPDTSSVEESFTSGTKRKPESSSDETPEESNARKKAKVTEDPSPSASKIQEQASTAATNDENSEPVQQSVPTKSSGQSGDKPKLETSGTVVMPSKSSSDSQDEGIAENLVCIICQEIFHDCISLQPCMHSFCAGCYSDWMQRSQECPSCRLNVDRINKNHMVNNLVDAYLKKHPEKRRPKEDLEALDKRNTIKKDTLKPPLPRRTMSAMIDDEEDDYDSEDHSGSDEDDEEEEEYVSPAVPAIPLPGLTIGVAGNIIAAHPPVTRCRKCPATGTQSTFMDTAKAFVAAAADMFKTTGAGTSAAAATASDAGEGTSAAVDGEDTEFTTVTTADGVEKRMPVAPDKDYVCGPVGTATHLLCQCCLQPMPDRRDAPFVAPQSCSLCRGLYCHMYWGCLKASCTGCLAKFKDLAFSKNAMDGLLLENLFESDILRGYLKEKGMSVQDLFKECCAKLESGDYDCIDKLRGLKASTVVCYRCGLRNFRDLAYQYRKSIKKEDLPAGVTGRPDCHWGRQCRTQRGKHHHAANYNHICDQTKF